MSVCNTIFVLLWVSLVHGEFNIFSLSSMRFHSEPFDINKDLIFRLYTREQPDVHQVLKADSSASPSISQTSFDSKRPTRIFIHGFKSKDKVIIRYKNAFLKLGDYNFIAVDWTEGATTKNYYAAKACVRPISEKLAELVTVLGTDRGMNLRDVTIVGHSLGAHIAGRAAKILQLFSQQGGSIACIIGLDPASFGFSSSSPEKRLAKTDADYVQVIHTDGEKFGLHDPIGTADFYPNGGKNQPGCPERNMLTQWIDKCSHVRAHDLFLESLTANFTAIHCESYLEMQNGLCPYDTSTSPVRGGNLIAPMGGDITAETTPKPDGIYYLETKGQSPYLIPNYQKISRTVVLNSI